MSDPKPELTLKEIAIVLVGWLLIFGMIYLVIKVC